MSRAQQRVLLLLGAAAAVLAVFVGALLLLGGTAKPPTNVLIKLATPGKTPFVALATPSAAVVTPTRTPSAPTTSTPSIVTATPPPAPTRTPSPTPSPSPSPSPTPSPSPRPTPTTTPAPPTPQPRGLPDLALLDFDLAPGGSAAGTLRITVGNLGVADVVQQGIDILAIDQTGTEVAHFTSGPVTIPTGGSVTILSTYKPAKRTTLTVVINSAHSIAEADAPSGFDDPNNARTKTVTPP